MPLPPGTRLGPYEVIAFSKAGGMGEVYLATDTRLDRMVAVKVLPTMFAGDPERRRRFELEARAVARLTHPCICALFDVGHEDGHAFLVMEHLEGETLGERLRLGPLPMKQVLRYGIEIAEALAAAHKQGIVHRDLKPGNVMLTRSGAKLLDFGVAKMRAAVANEDHLHLVGAATEEEPGVAGRFGTVQYMSPEQIEGRPWTGARTSSPSDRCSTRWPPESRPSRATPMPKS